LARAVGDDVVDNLHEVSCLVVALNATLSALALIFFARVDERQVALEAGRHRQGQSRIRDARDPVSRAAAHLGGHEDADAAQHVGKADDHAEIDVERRLDPGLEGEVTEAHGPDLEEAADEGGVLAGGGHARISSRMAAAALAGSAAAVMGRPTTR